MNTKHNVKPHVNLLSEFAHSQNIDRATIIRVLEETLRAVVKQTFGNDTNFETIVNLDNGDIQIWRYRDIVKDSDYNPTMTRSIALSEAKKIEHDFEVGEQVAEEVDFAKFGRRAVSAAKQTLKNVIIDLKNKAILNKYEDKIGQLVDVEVVSKYTKELLVADSEGYLLSIPQSFQIKKDRFRKGDMLKAVLHEVRMQNNCAKVVLSRTSPQFLSALLEAEIPEIKEGIIEIKAVVRDPGERAKVVVRTLNPNIDPVGACIGVRGGRIESIIAELHNENIDVINYTESSDLYISRILSPAKISYIKYLSDDRVAVYLRQDQVAKAIGSHGGNIKLASRLLGMQIEVCKEANDKNDLTIKEIEDSLDSLLVNDLIDAGFFTIRQVLDVRLDQLASKLDIDENQADEIQKVLLEIMSSR